MVVKKTMIWLAIRLSALDFACYTKSLVLWGSGTGFAQCLIILSRLGEVILQLVKYNNIWVGKSRRELKETFCSVPTVLELVR